jgi:hypothetical protein
MIWKSAIDLEISEKEPENVRELFSRLLEKSNHVKVWIALASFEAENAAGFGGEGEAYSVAPLIPIPFRD